MSDETESPKPLKPARPEPEELLGKPDYMPKIPWRWIVIFGSLIGLVYGAYQMRERQRADALRATLLDNYATNLASLSERYLSFRERIERWTLEAAQAGEPEQWVDPRLRISGLHGGEGIYLRLRAEQAQSAEGIAEGAQMMGTDAITRCLGILPSSARGLYATGDFLTPDFLEEVRGSSDFMRLRVMDEQLARNMEVDVPAIASMLGAEYFLLVIEQGENRRDAPVDVYLWDLGENRQLMRARIQARGILLPVRLRFDGVPPAPRPDGHPELHSGGAHDCSIAAQIKALTGEPPIGVSSGAQLEEAMREDEEAEAAAGAGTAPPPEGAPAPAAPVEAAPAPAAPATTP